MKLPFGDKKSNLLSMFSKTDSVGGQQVGFDEQSIPGLSDLYLPQEQEIEEDLRNEQPLEAGEEPSREEDIVDVLLSMGCLSREQYEAVREDASKNRNLNIKSYLLSSAQVTETDIQAAEAHIFGFEFREIHAEDVSTEAYGKLDVEFIKSNYILPVTIDNGVLVLAVANPSDLLTIDDVKRRTHMEVRVVVCSKKAIEAVCEIFEQQHQVDYCVDDIISGMTEVEVVKDESDESGDLEQMAGQSPVIKFVNYLISNAIKEGASDIHIEPKSKFTKIRHRIDGILFESMQAPLKMHPAIVSRIKIMSNLDISERRLPQDGKIAVIIGGRGIDLRVSILPTNNGEKVVIRVLDSKSILRGLEDLGMENKAMEAFRNQILLPHGILLVTGPTGSGKSTTLYSALAQMDGDGMNISTVEDPVEYELGFCNQVQANERIGFTFAAALRSLLRQDPDIIMIGEIRDNETARIAVQAALTGHLVLSTLHTNDASSSVTRLVNIGIDPYLIAASLNAVLAQRLVRRICPKCKELYQVPENMRKNIEKAGIKKDELYHGVGCEACRGSGYSGRVGIYELLVINEAFRDMINKDSSVVNMRHAFVKTGADSLYDDGIKKVKKGLTTIEEVLRVTEVYGQSEDEDFVENIK
ncbi:MAG TPA: GspE/PulE family protein [Sedimentisphaerales bacterium]|nr:GspE/PulE family protein [Sedimentisphaerales bacterium]